MVQWHTESLRKPSGGLRRSIRARHKQLHEKGGIEANTRITEEGQEEKRKTLRTMGNTVKTKALRLKFANITDPQTKKTSSWEITTVKQNLANKLFVRRNIITKNAIIEVKNASKTTLARVTSRPGQSGTIEGTLLSAEEVKAFQQESEKAPREEKKAKPKAEPAKTEEPAPAMAPKKAEKEAKTAAKKTAKK